MAQNHPSLSRSPGSRTSFMSVGRMPVIDEHEEVRPVPSIVSVATTASPLRIPQKSYRRSAARGLPPPYVPTTYLPSYQYQYQLSKEAERGFDRGRRGRLVDFWDHARGWFADRGRTCRYIMLLGVFLVVIIIALAIGLTFGLRNRDSDGGTQSTGNRNPRFPVGSYAFNTTLQRTVSDCTSNPSTWRCYPYEHGESASFFWIITQGNPGSFNISSSDNPFAPSFSNVTLEILDGNEPTERLVFSFSMEKTVVPGGGITPSNRAAQCTFDDTTFEATLWTRRRRGRTIDLPPPAQSDYTAWPGDVEVAQVKPSALGSPPRCQDSSGTAIADVQAATGGCECRYASFELD
ncbi:hypothetical protein B0I35DRAFT_408336 [Stachybotrys elegans]|uniref:Tat pathway signal sequence n=1 Tax=Stachybotrys elegans TaxID=80388 RepID=A0A8K0WTP1_9HYPO|nr:hypothetical protein B0I35DRAFT_408336 [Stachybotrys elegans]